MVKIFHEKKGELFNISDIVSHRLRTLESKFSSLMTPATTGIFAGADPSQPGTSTRPVPPRRTDSMPMLDINVSPQTIQATVQAMERQTSKYQKYLLKQASEDLE